MRTPEAMRSANTPWRPQGGRREENGPVDRYQSVSSFEDAIRYLTKLCEQVVSLISNGVSRRTVISNILHDIALVCHATERIIRFS